MSIGRPPSTCQTTTHETTSNEPASHEPAGRETAGGPPPGRTSSGKGHTRRLLRGLRHGEVVYMIVEDPR